MTVHVVPVRVQGLWRWREWPVPLAVTCLSTSTCMQGALAHVRWMLQPGRLWKQMADNNSIDAGEK